MTQNVTSTPICHFHFMDLSYCYILKQGLRLWLVLRCFIAHQSALFTTFLKLDLDVLSFVGV